MKAPVPVTGSRFIPDLYEELLRLEADGRLTINRYETHSDRAKASFDRVILQSVREHHSPGQPGGPYIQFIRTHRPDLL